jgi:hypothetical protein
MIISELSAARSSFALEVSEDPGRDAASARGGPCTRLAPGSARNDAHDAPRPAHGRCRVAGNAMQGPDALGCGCHSTPRSAAGREKRRCGQQLSAYHIITVDLVRCSQFTLCATFCREQLQQCTCSGGSYSITSSARASSEGGTVRPNAFAVSRLITRSNLVACSTGRSLGLAPRSILSTYPSPRAMLEAPSWAWATRSLQHGQRETRPAVPPRSQL